MPVDASPYAANPAPNPLNQLQQTMGIANTAAQNRAINTGIEREKLDIANKHFDELQGYLGSLLAKPDLSSGDIISTMSDLVATKRLSPQEAAVELSKMPSGKNGQPASQEELRGWVNQHVLQGLDMQSRMNALYGTPTTVNTGGATQIMSISPMTGARSLGAIPNTLPPTTEVFNPATNQYEYMGAGGGGGGAAAMGAAEDMGSSSGGDTAPVRPNPRGRLAASAPLGAPEAAAVTGQASAQQGVSLQQAADLVPQRKALLGQMEASLGDFTSGPGAERWKNLVAGSGRLFGLKGTESIASQEEFKKLATQLAQSQFQALGGTGTDAKLDSAVSSSPNDFLTNMGNKKIIALLKGNEDALAVKNREWQTYLQAGGSPAEYGKFSTEFNRTYDPRVFQSQYMSGSERQKMLKGMSKNEVEQFKEAYQKAGEEGWIK